MPVGLGKVSAGMNAFLAERFKYFFGNVGPGLIN
jgi:hypothetical protein